MLIPGYQILEEIGRGGTATVYVAIQVSLHRKVALKVLSRTLVSNPDFCQRFLQEGKIVAQLVHPHIVTVYDIGRHESDYFMSMEYIAGGHLKQRLGKALSVSQSLHIVQQIAGALGYAHERGFVHRDVKSRNILFREDGSAVLSDFGIAKNVSEHTYFSSAGITVGSPRYMSPEQALGKALDARSDLYSLGIVLYEMLTASVPFEAENPFALAHMHLRDPIPRLPRSLASLQPVLDRLLAKSPQDRYSAASELLDALDRVSGGGAADITCPGASQSATVSADSGERSIDTDDSPSLIPDRHIAPKSKTVIRRRRRSRTQYSKALLGSSVLLAVLLAAYVQWIRLEPDTSQAVRRADNTAAQRAPRSAEPAEPRPPSSRVDPTSRGTDAAGARSTEHGIGSSDAEAAGHGASIPDPDAKDTPESHTRPAQVGPPVPDVSTRLLDPGVMMQGGRQVISTALEQALRMHARRVERLSDGSVKITLLDEVSFKPASAQIDPQAYKTLDELAFVLRNYSGFTVEVVAHTEFQSPQSTELKIARRRAQAIAAYLISHGMPPSHVRFKGRGGRLAVVHNGEDPLAHSRVEVILKPFE